MSEIVSSVKKPPVRRGNQEPLSRASDQAGRDHQVNHVNQQVDGCQDGHSQLLVPDAHTKPSIAACISEPLGLPTELLVELIERPEDSSSGVEEDGEHSLPKHKMRGGQPIVTVTPVPQYGYEPQDEADGIHSHTPHQGRVVHVQGGVADEGEDGTGHSDL